MIQFALRLCRRRLWQVSGHARGKYIFLGDEKLYIRGVRFGMYFLGTWSLSIYNPFLMCDSFSEVRIRTRLVHPADTVKPPIVLR